MNLEGGRLGAGYFRVFGAKNIWPVQSEIYFFRGRIFALGVAGVVLSNNQFLSVANSLQIGSAKR